MKFVAAGIVIYFVFPFNWFDGLMNRLRIKNDIFICKGMLVNRIAGGTENDKCFPFRLVFFKFLTLSSVYLLWPPFVRIGFINPFFSHLLKVFVETPKNFDASFIEKNELLLGILDSYFLGNFFCVKILDRNFGHLGLFCPLLLRH